MDVAKPGILDRFKQPDYTGENRCVPCTAVNVAIALVASAALWFVWEPLAAGFLAVALAAIYLRGYLVPGTPTLTKRYFPDRVLRWFDKAPEREAPVAGTEAEIEPEPILLEAGAVEPCMGGEDLCATAGFADARREEIRALREGGDDALAERLADLLECAPDDVVVEESRYGVRVRRDGQPVARWESRAALLGDAASVPELRRRVDGWSDLDIRQQGRLLNGARVFLERCPACDEELAFAEETRESCCRSVDVVALECPACDSVLLEVEAAG